MADVTPAPKRAGRAPDRLLPRPAGRGRAHRRYAAPGQGWARAEGAVRDASRHPAAANGRLHDRADRGRLPALSGAPTARGLRLRRVADRDLDPAAGAPATVKFCATLTPDRDV